MQNISVKSCINLTVWKLAPHSSAAHFKMNKFNIPHAAGAEARA